MTFAKIKNELKIKKNQIFKINLYHDFFKTKELPEISILKQITPFLD